MPRRLLLIIVLVAGAGLAAAPPVLAAVPSGGAAPLAVLGIDFPTVKEIVGDVVKFFFGSLLDALVPDWMRDMSVGVIRRLVTIPNPANAQAWPTLARLAEGMRWIALPLLSLAVVAAWAQQFVREMMGRSGSLTEVLPRTALAAVLLAAYPTLIANAVALVNSVTSAILSLPVVAQGIERTVGLVFAGSLLSGSGVLLALLGIAAVILTVGLFMLSIGLLVVFALAYVSAPLAIACSVLDETRGVWAAWRYTVLTATLVPVGWCVLFATAGAVARDMTTWTGGITGTVGARFVGVIAALVILWLAIRWPLMLWSTIRLQLAGLLAPGRPVSAAHQASAAGIAARTALQRTTMSAASGLSTAISSVRTTAGTSARAAADKSPLVGNLEGDAGGAIPAGGRATASAARSATAPPAARAATTGKGPSSRGRGADVRPPAGTGAPTTAAAGPGSAPDPGHARPTPRPAASAKQETPRPATRSSGTPPAPLSSSTAPVHNPASRGNGPVPSSRSASRGATPPGIPARASSETPTRSPAGARGVTATGTAGPSVARPPAPSRPALPASRPTAPPPAPPRPSTAIPPPPPSPHPAPRPRPRSPPSGRES